MDCFSRGPPFLYKVAGAISLATANVRFCMYVVVWCEKDVHGDEKSSIAT